MNTGKQTGRLMVGTSGWWYKDWAGTFYPPGMQSREWLGFYAEHFKAVELNASFYRLPFKNMLKGMSNRVPQGFVFAAKGSRSVTHIRRLKDVQEQVARFYERMSMLSGLDVVLWQLPPSLKQDLDLLHDFLELLPASPRVAMEFRHESWWDPGTVEVLKKFNAAFCAISHPKLPDTFMDSADFAYIRFHGLGQRLYDYDYSTEEMAPFALTAAQVLSSGRDVYAFFNNDFHANAIKNAQEFLALAGKQV